MNQLGYCWICSIHRTSVFRYIIDYLFQCNLFHLISSPFTPFDFICPSFSTPYFSISHFPSSSTASSLLSTTVFQTNTPILHIEIILILYPLKTSSQSKPIPFQSPLFALALIFDRFPSSSSSSSYPFPVIKSRLNPLECTA